MSPTKPAGSDPLMGLDAFLASQPLSPTPRGGTESGFRGESSTSPQAAPASQPQGQGPWLEESDKDVFQQMNGLVLRQELLKLNHLAQDVHWQYVKLGYPWSTLTKDPGKDTYKQTLPYGAASISIQPVPNKLWDLVKKTKEALLVDFPQAEAEPLDDSEDAANACEMANRFLAQDASEQGTNDTVLYGDRVERALTSATSYIEYWVDPVGGGYVPLQIKAHPQAEDPSNPLVGPDGQTTTEYVLRYVTAPEGGQFTDDPSQAAPQWRPKIRASKWQREHVRVFPETVSVEHADKVLILGYCTLGEAKKRWPTVAQMPQEQLSKLCDWTPPRYLVLLPPQIRARWKLTDGREKEKQGSSDERLMFYYHGYAKPSPDYPKGANVVVSGIDGGMILDRQLLAKPVPVKKDREAKPEIRCMEIPVVQVTPVGDPDDQDPTGRAYVEPISGACENQAHLAMGYSEVLDKNLHTPFAVPGTSPIEGWEVEEARASGDFLTVRSKDDLPAQLEPPIVPAQFVEFYQMADDTINSMGSQNRPAQGSDKQQEVSGKARQIAVDQNNVALSGMQTAVNNAYARGCRIKIELAMAHFTTEQQVAYVGEDGSYQQDEWTGTDFALVGKVSIKTGTGTLMPPNAKVNYLGNLVLSEMITADEAKDAARPAFSKQLGLPPDPHEQHVQRCIASWEEGPPAPQPGPPGAVDPTTGQPAMVTWEQQWQQYAQQKAQYDQAQQQYQAAVQRFQFASQMQAVAMAGPPQPLGPEGQNEQAAVQHSQAVLWLQQNPDALTMPQPPQLQAPQAPWHPFQPRPNDQEPAIAALWQRKLSRVMSTVKYTQFSPEWRAPFDQMYQQATQVLQAVQQAAQPQQKRAA